METELLHMILILAAAGVLAGFMAGLLGIGGGVVMVPVLYWVLLTIELPPDMVMHMAIGTSLAIIVPTGMASARAHWKQGAVSLTLIWAWAPFIFAGALLGAAFASNMSGAALTLFFASIVVILGLRLILSGDRAPVRDQPPTGFVGGSLAGLIGLLSSMMGIGGASFSVPLMTMTGYEMHRAIGTASLFGVIIAVPAALGFLISGHGLDGLPEWATGYIYLPAFLVMTPFAAIMAPVGAASAHRLKRKPLAIIFGLFLILAGLRMAWPFLA